MSTAEPTPEEDQSDMMGHRQERIRIETERHRIEGSITLARDGYRSRVSDVLNASERDFLTLTEVTVEPLDGGPVELHEYLTLARRHIVFAVAASAEGSPEGGKAWTPWLQDVGPRFGEPTGAPSGASVRQSQYPWR
jgi:hypothetical protein